MHDPCYANDWNVRERSIFELMLAKLPTIHHRHTDVQEHDTRTSLSHQGEGFRAIFRCVSFVAVGAEEEQDHPPHGAVVVHDQHAWHQKGSWQKRGQLSTAFVGPEIPDRLEVRRSIAAQRVSSGVFFCARGNNFLRGKV
jgi:hypothetical protein